MSSEQSCNSNNTHMDIAETIEIQHNMELLPETLQRESFNVGSLDSWTIQILQYTFKDVRIYPTLNISINIKFLKAFQIFFGLSFPFIILFQADFFIF